MKAPKTKLQDPERLHAPRSQLVSPSPNSYGVIGKSPGRPAHKATICAAQSRRDCVLQPRVARNELPWERMRGGISTPKGLRLGVSLGDATSSRLVTLRHVTQ